MANRRERFIVIKQWARQRCPSFSPWRIGNGLSNLAVSSRNLALFFALMVGASSGFAQIANVTPPETATASIEGVVTVAGQGQVEAVPGMLVKLTGPSSAPDPLSFSTDAEGRYRFTKLSPGSYTIEARLEGFKPFAES